MDKFTIGFTTYFIQVFEPLNIPLLHVQSYGYPTSSIPDCPRHSELKANYKLYEDWHNLKSISYEPRHRDTTAVLQGA